MKSAADIKNMENLLEQHLNSNPKYHWGLVLATFSLISIAATFFGLFGRAMTTGFAIGFFGLIAGIILAKVGQKKNANLVTPKPLRSLVIGIAVICGIIAIAILGLMLLAANMFPHA